MTLLAHHWNIIHTFTVHQVAYSIATQKTVMDFKNEISSFSRLKKVDTVSKTLRHGNRFDKNYKNMALEKNKNQSLK